MRTLLTLPAALALLMAAGMLTGCGDEAADPAPADAVAAGSPAAEPEPEPEPPQPMVDWYRDASPEELPYDSQYPQTLTTALVQAHEQQRPLLLRFYNSTSNDRDMETTYAHHKVKAAMRRYLLAEVDVKYHVELLHAFIVRDAPTHIVLTPSGDEVARDGGFRWPRYFANWLNESWPMEDDPAPLAGDAPTTGSDPEGS